MSREAQRGDDLPLMGEVCPSQTELLWKRCIARIREATRDRCRHLPDHEVERQVLVEVRRAEYRRLFCRPELTCLMTGTFRYERSEWGAIAVVDSVLRRLGQMIRGAVPAVWVVDWGDSGNRCHLHLHAGGVDHLPQSFLERAWGSRRIGWLKIERPVWLPAARYIAKKIVPIDECAQEPEWGMWPGNFMQAIRRVRRQAKERQQEGIYLYDAGGRAVNAKEAMS